MSQARRRIFLAITLLVPALVLGAAELALRIAGVGALEPLFVPVPADTRYLQPNPAVIQRFFPDPRDAPDVSIDTTWFLRDKPRGLVRVFVLGESTAAGFPYGRWASPAALLQQRLARAYPGRDFEVISTAMAAVTSYVLLDFADEIVAQHPDAVVIYTGHNEYLGIGGVGSSLVSAKSPTAARLVGRLRRLHLYRALEVLVSRIGPARPRLSERDGTLMSKVAAERSIPIGSPLYDRGLEQFRGNLDRLLNRYERAGVPVFIGTLACNERDQPPFSSVASSGSTETAAQAYARAQSLESSGQLAAARAAYLTAKDLDALRFRAPESFNTVIRETAASRTATVVDVQSALAAASPGGIIGRTLMLEHVHPNVEGYFALASAYWPALAAWLGPPTVPVDDATARSESPVTEVDRLDGEYRIAMLRNDWPFVPQRVATQLPTATTPIEAIAQRWFAGGASWLEAMQEALAVYQKQGNATEAARVAVNVADAVVNSDAAQITAARLLLQAGAPERGLRYARRAIAVNPAPIEYYMSLAQAQFASGDKAASKATLESVLARHPDELRAKYWLEVVTSKMR